MSSKMVLKKLVYISTIVSMCLCLGGCNTNQSVSRKDSSGEESTLVTIPILLRSEPDSGESTYSDLIDGFNRKYEGKYQLDVTLISETEEGYRNRLKELNAIDELPVIITDAAFDSDFLALMEENNRYYGLYPLSDGFYSSAGMYYNMDILRKCGISSYPDTWEEFFTDCEILKAAGYTPIALHGGGDYWSALLIATAYMSRNEAGADFLKVALPESYNNPEFKAMLGCVKRLYDYSYSDALNISHGQSLSRFLSGDAAMIPGGYWMIPQMEEVEFNIGFSTFSEGEMLVDNRMSAWAIVNNDNEAAIEGARLFMEYRKANTLDKEKSSSSISKEYEKAYDRHTAEFPNYQLQWQEKVIKEDFDSLMPALIKDDITEDEFISQLYYRNAIM